MKARITMTVDIDWLPEYCTEAGIAEAAYRGASEYVGTVVDELVRVELLDE